jgi:hypothetical protein
MVRFPSRDCGFAPRSRVCAQATEKYRGLFDSIVIAFTVLEVLYDGTAWPRIFASLSPIIFFEQDRQG